MAYILAVTELERQILRALKTGPLYRPLLELVLSEPSKTIGEALLRLEAAGLVHRVGEAWSLTIDGHEAIA